MKLMTQLMLYYLLYNKLSVKRKQKKVVSSNLQNILKTQLDLSKEQSGGNRTDAICADELPISVISLRWARTWATGGLQIDNNQVNFVGFVNIWVFSQIFVMLISVCRATMMSVR
jgi:hypothetical protein